MLCYRSPLSLRTSLVIVFSALSVNAIAVAQTDRWSDLTGSAGQLAAQGRFAEAVPVARQALAEAESRYGKQSANYGSSLAGLGFLLMSTGDYTSAETDITQGIGVIRAALGVSSLQLASPMANLTQLYMLEATAQSANPAKSAPLLQQADASARSLLALGEKNYPADDPALSGALEGLCYVLAAEQKYAEAKPLLLRSLSIETANLPADHVQIVRTRNELAWVLNATGDTAGAREQYTKALASAEKTLGANDPVTNGIRESLRRLSSANSTPGSNARTPRPSAGM